MAMLAEPRQRKRYNLVPRGKALYEDDSRFGTKMLERMGWSKGKGLGPKEDGSQDFVRVRYKNDIQGLGFEHRDDQWTQHESSFNGLLQALNCEEVAEDVKEKEETHKQCVESEDDMPRVGFGFQNVEIKKPKTAKKSKLKEEISGISLEERSKQSKARVHYQKFTRGKDLSQYSEKDLANIFGKKAEDEQESAVNDMYQQLNQNFNKAAEKETKDGGVQMISSVLSVADYFKMKMTAIKNKKGQTNSENNSSENCIADVEEDQQDNSTRKKKKVKNEQLNPEDNSKEDCIADVEKDHQDNSTRKKKKVKNEQLNPENNCIADTEEDQQGGSTRKKKKMTNEDKDELAVGVSGKLDGSKDNYDNVENMVSENRPTENDSLEKNKGKEKKNKKNRENYDNIENMEYETRPKKKCKQSDLSENDSSVKNKGKEKKKKKNKNIDADEKELKSVEEFISKNIETNEAPEEKKKSKKRKNNPSQNEDDGHSEKKVKADSEHIQKVEGIAIKNSQPCKYSKGQNKNEDNKPSGHELKKINLGQANEGGKSEVGKQNQKDKDESQAVTLDEIRELSINELNDKLNCFNVYSLSSFSAEKFRNINLNFFPSSTLPTIEGYSFSQDIKLSVKVSKLDEKRITNLWKSTLSKYSNLVQPKKTYIKYIKEVRIARKTKQRVPKFSVKSWKRKNAFSII